MGKLPTFDQNHDDDDDDDDDELYSCVDDLADANCGHNIKIKK